MNKPFFVWRNKALKKINPEHVVYLETQGNYTKIFLADKTYHMVRSTLSDILNKLPPDIFIKIHRSFVASVHYMDEINKEFLLVGEEEDILPVGKQYYKSLIEKLVIIE